MEAALKTCPFLSKATISQVAALKRSTNQMTRCALACPVMSGALQARGYAATPATRMMPNECSFETSVETVNIINSSNIRLNTCSSSSSSFTTKAKNCPIYDYEQVFETEIQRKKLDASYRIFNNINRLAKQYPKGVTGNGDEVAVWCSNDYLGMGRHPVVLKAMREAMETFGAGAGGTRNIAGNSNLHLMLEQELADLHGKEAALLFSSCFVANDATLSTLINKLPGCIVFSDASNHASMVNILYNLNRYI